MSAFTPEGGYWLIYLPDDVALVACFLTSEEARFVTGEITEVNGGFYFR